MLRSPQVAARLAAGDHAPNITVYGPGSAELELATLWQEAPIVLTFLRHFG